MFALLRELPFRTSACRMWIRAFFPVSAARWQAINNNLAPPSERSVSGGLLKEDKKWQISGELEPQSKR
jgi:hypothetical protein